MGGAPDPLSSRIRPRWAFDGFLKRFSEPWKEWKWKVALLWMDEILHLETWETMCLLVSTE